MSETSATAAAPPPAQPSWRRRSRGGRAGNGFFILLIRSGGMFLAPFFLFWVAAWFLLTAAPARQASFDLAKRLGHAGRGRRIWFGFRHFYTFGMLLLDRVAILAADQSEKYRSTFHGEEEIREAIAQGKGVILQSAHLGNWEVMGQLVNRLDAPFNMVMFDAVDPKVKATMEALASHRSFRILYSDGTANAAAAILAALRAGEIVGLMGDRVVAGDAVPARILGDQASLPAGGYVLSAAAKAPLFFAFAVRTGWRRYSLHGHGVGVLRYESRRHKQRDLERWAQLYADQIESYLRAFPHQWGNFFPFWTR